MLGAWYRYYVHDTFMPKVQRTAVRVHCCYSSTGKSCDKLGALQKVGSPSYYSYTSYSYTPLYVYLLLSFMYGSTTAFSTWRHMPEYPVHQYPGLYIWYVVVVVVVHKRLLYSSSRMSHNNRFDCCLFVFLNPDNSSV